MYVLISYHILGHQSVITDLVNEYVNISAGPRRRSTNLTINYKAQVQVNLHKISNLINNSNILLLLCIFLKSSNYACNPNSQCTDDPYKVCMAYGPMIIYTKLHYEQQ